MPEQEHAIESIEIDLPGPADRRVEELATGFALDELGEDELVEFYEVLKRRDEKALRAAEVTWRILHQSLDLRTTFDRDFIPTVRERIAREREQGQDARPSENRGLIGTVLGRLGFRRPGLEAVASPDGEGGGGRNWSVGAVLAFLLLAAGGLLLIPWRGAPVATLEVVHGLVSAEGTVYVAGEVGEVARELLTVPPGALVRLSWENGSEVVVRGPASASPRPAGVAVNGGLVWVEAGKGFAIGLPDRQVVCEESASLSIQVIEGSSLVGVLAGEVVGGPPDSPDRPTIAAGDYLAADGRIHPWLHDARLAGGEGQMRLEVEPPTDQPSLLYGVFTPENKTDRVIWSDRDDNRIHLEAGKLALEVGDGIGSERPLEGSPLKQRAFTFIQDGSGTLRIRVTGLENPTTVAMGMPRAVTFRGAARIEQLEFYNGPPPRSDSPLP